MKITKEQANKILEQIKLLEGMWVPGDDRDDEGNWRNPNTGRGVDYYPRRRRYANMPAPGSHALPDPDSNEQSEATRIANVIAKNKGQLQADQGLINWVLKQRAMGKLGGKVATAPVTPAAPIAESHIVLEVKEELLESASMLLEIYKDLIIKKGK